MEIMMELQRLLGHARGGERIVGVREVGKLESHGVSFVNCSLKSMKRALRKQGDTTSRTSTMVEVKGFLHAMRRRR
ncbi:hypothetical protein D3C86_1430030 [compost metagenome]